MLSLWADEAALQESAAAGRDIGAVITEASGTTRVALEDFEVTYLLGELMGEDIAIG
jgi:hypothetical protein